MSIRKRVILRLAAVMMMTIMVFGSASSAFAAVPTKDEIEYDGAGRVEGTDGKNGIDRTRIQNYAFAERT